mmetsp:Transcript_23515/g.65413  ORF Transcript_23515/g.65413 Transcript_23515/m.65413 type:complete len:209 (-) Transcript_23515:76-702(-)
MQLQPTFLTLLVILLSLVSSCAFTSNPASCRSSITERHQASSENEMSSNTAATTTLTGPQWFQHQISITAPSRGCHLITGEVQKHIGNDLSKIRMGMCNLFVQHTSASLTINENADPDVRTDMETAMNKIVPAKWNRDGTFRHTMEGDDDMPGHVKSSMMGVSLNIPIRNGRLALGTWQGIYLNEHRDQGGWGGGHTRNIVITLQGMA